MLSGSFGVCQRAVRGRSAVCFMRKVATAAQDAPGPQPVPVDWSDLARQYDDTQLTAITYVYRIIKADPRPHPIKKLSSRVAGEFQKTIEVKQVNDMLVHSGIASIQKAKIRLERPLNDPIETLGDTSDELLDQELWQLYEQLVPSPGAYKARTALIRAVEHKVQRALKDNNYRAMAFGNVYTEDSDLDICITIVKALRRNRRYKRLPSIQRIRDAIKPLCRGKPVLVPKARVPLVKFLSKHNIRADVNVGHTIGIDNSRLLLGYVRYDERVRPMIYLVKAWARARRIKDPALGTLSSYSYILMIVHFLQRLKIPVLPSAQTHGRQETQRHQEKQTVHVSFCSRAREIKLPERNTDSLACLLKEFFGFYAGRPSEYYSAPFTSDDFVQIRHTGPSPKHDLAPTFNRTRFTVLDPFIDRNCGGTCLGPNAQLVADEFERAARLLYSNHSFDQLLRYQIL